MERLWAPWRMTYIRRIGRMKCFLCAYGKQPRRDAQNFVLKRGRSCFAFLNRYPYTSGHLLVAPYAHKGDLDQLSPAEVRELLALAAEMKGLLDRAIHPHGYNLGINLGRAAGAGVPGHLHLHLVPRWQGDTNFMPVVGGATVIPFPLREMCDLLRAGGPPLAAARCGPARRTGGRLKKEGRKRR